MNAGHVLFETAARLPDHPAIVYGARRQTYAQWLDRSRRLAGALAARGVRRGDRVATIQRNGPQLLETLFACFALGAGVVPINNRLHAREVQYIVDHSGAAALIFSEEYAAAIDGVRAEMPSVRHFVGLTATGPDVLDYEAILRDGEPVAEAEMAEGDLAWLFYTSGTTGRPKGAMITHGNLAFMTRQYVREVYPAGPEDRALHAAPLTHASGLWSLPLVAAGATHVLPTSARFDADEVLRLIEAERVTKVVFLAPTVINMLLNAPSIADADTSSVRFFGYGGAPMYVEDLKRAIARFGPVFCQIYGQGESPMTITMLAPADHACAGDPGKEARLASAGRVRDGIEVAVLSEADQPLPPGEIGEVGLRGPVVMGGYWNAPDATAEAFRNDWYHTGDVGRFDADGYLYLLDRKKDLVISGGANIYPREVEEVLLLDPGVLECAVFGVPDRFWGESVVALVVPRPGSDVNETRLLALCKDHLASYKKPRFLRFVDALPKNAYGKVLKRELRDAYRTLAVEP